MRISPRIVFLSFLLLPQTTFSQELDIAPLAIRLRTVTATGFASQPEAQTDSREVQSELVDVEQELLKLPYRSFSLGSDRVITTPLMKKSSISLTPKENITVRPVYREKGKVCLWVKWEDQNGMKVLDSRLHLKDGESLVVGTDHTEDSGVVLVVDVAPSKTSE